MTNIDDRELKRRSLASQPQGSANAGDIPDREARPEQSPAHDRSADQPRTLGSLSGFGPGEREGGDPNDRTLARAHAASVADQIDHQRRPVQDSELAPEDASETVTATDKEDSSSQHETGDSTAPPEPADVIDLAFLGDEPTAEAEAFAGVEPGEELGVEPTAEAEAFAGDELASVVEVPAPPVFEPVPPPPDELEDEYLSELLAGDFADEETADFAVGSQTEPLPPPPDEPPAVLDLVAGAPAAPAGLSSGRAALVPSPSMELGNGAEDGIEDDFESSPASDVEPLPPPPDEHEFDGSDGSDGSEHDPQRGADHDVEPPPLAKALVEPDPVGDTESAPQDEPFDGSGRNRDSEPANTTQPPRSDGAPAPVKVPATPAAAESEPADDVSAPAAAMATPGHLDAANDLDHAGAAIAAATDTKQTLGRWPSLFRSLSSQVRHQNRLFFRSPLMALFTLVLPVSLLALLRVIYSDNLAVRWDENGTITFAQFYVPALAAFTAAQATYGSLAVNLATQRDRGVLKRIRATPLPPWLYLTGAVVSAMFIAVLGAAIMVLAGNVFYGLDVDWSRIPPMLASFALGVATFAALGIALSSLIPGGSAAHAVANATLLPVAFISDVFIPLFRPPRWLDLLGDLLPLKPFSESLQLGFANPIPNFGTTEGPTGQPSIDLAKWAVMFAWLIIGLAVAKWRFRWNERDNS